MKFTDYLKDKILLVIVQIFCMLLLTGFLYATGYPLETCRVILLVSQIYFSHGFYGNIAAEDGTSGK